MPEKLLQVENLRVQFHTGDGVVEAVGGISFDLEAGETLGIVGESGSGKTVANLALLGLVPQPPGKIVSGSAKFAGRDLLRLSEREMADIRGRRIAMVFQDPMTALNPFLTIEQQLVEVTRRHLKHTRRQARMHAIDMLDMVGIPAAAQRVSDYPHQFSGGMRQRVMIAMALSCQPDILIADEPTTALDVTIQAQILELIRDMQKRHGTAVILITHDLGVVAAACRRVLVMYAGRIVEQAEAGPLFAQPRHPYTLGLMASVPRWDSASSQMLQAIEGQPPDLTRLPSGCAFHPRCPWRMERCDREPPALFDRPNGGRFACFADVTKPPAAQENAASSPTAKNLT